MSTKTIIFAFFFSLIFVYHKPSNAKLITYQGDGNTYDVTEKDKTKEIEEKTLNYLKRDNQNTSVDDRFRVKLKEQVFKSELNRTKKVDVTHTFKEDLKYEGTVIQHAGDRFNPLESVRMTNLIIIDGENENQIYWAIGKEKEFLGKGKTKILISNGSSNVIKTNHGIRVYRLNDDMKKLYQITHVPCTVSQDGKELLVHEYKI